MPFLNLYFVLLVLCLTCLLFFSSSFTPFSLGAALLSCSFTLVGMLNYALSTWYAYVLFLVYVGGLLVLFIYVCMVSTNFNFLVSYNVWPLFSVFAVFSFNTFDTFLSSYKSGQSSSETGVQLLSHCSVFLFISLVIFLLLVFLVVVRIVLSKGSVALSK